MGELGEVVRMVADGEASPAQRSALEAAAARLSPSDRAALESTIEAERSLREATSRCMREDCPPCPADLRGRVLKAVRAEESSSAPSSAPTPVDRASRNDDRGPFVFRLVQRNWPLAAAAAIVLMALVGLFVLPIVAPNSRVWPPDQAARVQLVSFLGGEHNHCAPMTRYSELKLPIREQDKAEAFISQWTPDASKVITMAGPDYRFLGVGPCGVPGGGDSMHMVFAPNGLDLTPISVFIQDASSREPQALPRTLAQLGETADGQSVQAFRHGECMVYVVSSSEDDAKRIAKSLGE
jgi:hypothetical protein